MNQRSFFKSLALLAAGAAVAPGIFVPKFEPVKWKVMRRTAVINPAWVTAKYEVYFIQNPAIIDPSILKPYITCGRVGTNVPYPVRGNELDKNGFPVSIPPFILV